MENTLKKWQLVLTGLQGVRRIFLDVHIALFGIPILADSEHFL